MSEAERTEAERPRRKPNKVERKQVKDARRSQRKPAPSPKAPVEPPEVNGNGAVSADLEPRDRAPQHVGRHPFTLRRDLQRLLCRDEVERRSPMSSEREILDCYMTSLFSAGLDNPNLYTGPKRWVVAFSPRRAWGDGLD